MRRLLCGFARKLPFRFEREAAHGNGFARRRWRWELQVETRFVAASALCFVFYFIASNTGCGWVYLLSASLLTAILLGLIAPALEVGLVDSSLSAPPKMVAGQTLNVIVTLARRAGWLTLLPVQWLRLSYEFDGCEKPSGIPPDQPILVEALGAKTSWFWTTQPLKRGVHHLGAVCLASCFPIGMAWWLRRLPAPESDTITVYPKVVPVDGFFLYRLKTSHASRGGLSRTNQIARQSTYTRGVREYIRGDSPRHVHWASSARTGRLLVREFEAEGFPNFDVLLDLAAIWTSRRQFELAVSAAGSLLALGHRLGIGPRLIVNPDLPELGLSLPAVPPGIEFQMEVLARVQPIRRGLSGTASGPEQDRLYGQQKMLVVIRPPSPHTGAEGNCYFLEVDDLERSRAADESPSAFKSRLCSEEDLVNL